VSRGRHRGGRRGPRRPPRRPRALAIVPAAPRRRGRPRRLPGALAPALLLESGDGGGWSYVVPTDGPVLRDDGDGPVLHAGRHRHALGPDPFLALDRSARRSACSPGRTRTPHRRRAPAVHRRAGRRVRLRPRPPHRGGRRPGTARPSPPGPRPVARQPRLAVAPDGRRAVLVGRPFDPSPRWRRPRRAPRRPDARTGAGTPAPALAARLARAEPSGDRPSPRAPPQPVATSLPADRYLDAVAQVLDRIAAGDVFQVNLTQRLTARWDGDAHASTGRCVRPAAPRSARACRRSASPRCPRRPSSPSPAGTVTTRPIKGTRPRAERSRRSTPPWPTTSRPRSRTARRT
jgi:hypothetical protein